MMTSVRTRVGVIQAPPAGHGLPPGRGGPTAASGPRGGSGPTAASGPPRGSGPPDGHGLPPGGNGPSDGDGSPWWSGRRVQHDVVQPLYVGRADLGQQIRYLAPARDLRVRVDVMPRGEDERALMRAGMGQGQLRVVAHDVTVDDDVQVERAGPPGLIPDPPEDGLDPVAPL